MIDKKVSVIIPIYKVEKYLDKCIQSVINQTYTNLEIILIDDGSPDLCPIMCEQYKEQDQRIVVVHKSNGGLSDARNAGLDVATGEYYAFLDGDDTLEPNAIEYLITAAIENSSKITMMKLRAVKEGETIPQAKPQDNICGEWVKNQEFLKNICTYKGSCSFCDKLFSREIFEEYRFRVGITNEDLLLLGTILIENDYDIYAIDYCGYNYLQRAQSITKSGFGKSIRDTIYNCWELQLLAQQYKLDLVHYFQELAIYQARTFLIFMPKRYIKEKNEDYLFAMSILKNNKKRIYKGFYSFKDKIFIGLCLFNIKIAKEIVGEK